MLEVVLLSTVHRHQIPQLFEPRGPEAGEAPARAHSSEAPSPAPSDEDFDLNRLLASPAPEAKAEGQRRTLSPRFWSKKKMEKKLWCFLRPLNMFFWKNITSIKNEMV